MLELRLGLTWLTMQHTPSLSLRSARSRALGSVRRGRLVGAKHTAGALTDPANPGSPMSSYHVHITLTPRSARSRSAASVLNNPQGRVGGSTTVAQLTLRPPLTELNTWQQHMHMTQQYSTPLFGMTVVCCMAARAYSYAIAHRAQSIT